MKFEIIESGKILFLNKCSDGGGLPEWVSWLSIPLLSSDQVWTSGLEVQAQLGPTLVLKPTLKNEKERGIERDVHGNISTKGFLS